METRISSEEWKTATEVLNCHVLSAYIVKGCWWTVAAQNMIAKAMGQSFEEIIVSMKTDTGFGLRVQ